MPNESILIVEDERKIADLLSDYFEKAGYRVSHLDSGERVAPQVRQDPPDLLLLDVMLPRMDGMEVCREIRKFSNLPILMVTARMEEIDRILGLELGADDYICKPFSPREVVARAKAILRRINVKPPEPKLTAGPISLDEVTRLVLVENRPLNLTPSEFALLKTMMLHPNRVFSRTELLDMALGYQHEGYDRSVDTHIKNLRKKLAERMPEEEIIHTAYGIGYQLSLQSDRI